jgi:hypothetical protein
LLQFLLKLARGSDINTMTVIAGFFFGYTPLDFARQESTAGHREVEAALLEHRPFFKIIWSMQSQWSHGGVNP